jgi:BirA family biotin operon repressor/biotin-[acetyl-CoA-carboxylase] ligase
VGGILGEAEIAQGRIGHLVVGVGVNLDAPEGVPGAGAIGDVDEEELLSVFLQKLRSLIDGPAEEIVDRWRAVSATLGRRVEARTVGNDVASGVAVDLDETGALLVDTDAGRVRVTFGEIVHLDVDRG